MSDGGAVESSWSSPVPPWTAADSARVPSLPNEGIALLVRTDFANDADWTLLCAQASAPSEEERINPYAVSLDSERWQADGLLNGAGSVLSGSNLVCQLALK